MAAVDAHGGPDRAGPPGLDVPGRSGPEVISSPDLDVAVRSCPGVDPRRADVVEVVEVGAGRWAVAVASAEGPGAAGLAAALGTGARTCARLDLPVQEVLAALDDLVRDHAGSATASCTYAVLDPYAGGLCLGAAGAPPAVLRSPSGGVQLLDLDGAASLGTREAHAETRRPMPPGATLAVVSRGVPAGDATAGALAVAAALAGGPGGLAPLADHVLAASPAGAGRTLLLVRVPPDIAARSTGVTVPVPRDRGRLGEARERVRGLARQWALVDEVADAAGQIAAELVGNAVVHGRGQVELRLRLTRDRLVVEVADEGTHLPRRRRTRADDERGRGLHLVTALAHRWGARPTDTGKLVWAELDLAAG